MSVKERRDRFGVAGAILLVAGPFSGSMPPLAHAIERRLYDGGGSAVLLYADDAVRWIPAARSIADAGLLAVVSLESALLDAARAAIASEENRLLVVRANEPGASHADPPKAPPTLIDVSGSSAEEGAAAVIKSLRARGWVA